MSPDDTAWRERLAALCEADAKAIRPTIREWQPISRDPDPIRARARRRTVQRAIRLHVAACPMCGKGSPLDVDDSCRCGTSPTQWEGAVWSAAAAVRDAP